MCIRDRAGAEGLESSSERINHHHHAGSPTKRCIIYLPVHTKAEGSQVHRRDCQEPPGDRATDNAHLERRGKELRKQSDNSDIQPNASESPDPRVSSRLIVADNDYTSADPWGLPVDDQPTAEPSRDLAISEEEAAEQPEASNEVIGESLSLIHISEPTR